MKRFLKVALPAVLVVFWIAARTVSEFPVVFPPDSDPVLLGNDPWFHLHHSDGAARHFPRLLRWDVGTHYPTGSYSDAAGLFNLLIAGAALILGHGNPSQELVAAVLCWSPIVLGAASLLFLFLIARDLGGYRVGIFALLTRVLLPGEEIDRTVLGFGDNHAVEIFLASIGLWMLVRNLRQPDSPMTLFGSVARAIPVALPWLAFLFTWYGAPLHILTLILSFWVAVILETLQGRSHPARLLHVSWVFLWIAILLALIGWLWPELIMKRRAFYPVLILIAIQAGVGVIAARGLPALVKQLGSVRAIVVAGVLGLLSAAAAFLASAKMRHFASLLLEKKAATISEQLTVDAAMVWSFFGPVTLLILGGFVISWFRQASFPTKWVNTYIFLWAGFWYLSSDYGYLVCSLLPIPAALAADRLISISAESVTSRVRFLIRVTPCALLAATLLSIWPLRSVDSPWFSRHHAEAMVVATEPWRDAMAWMKNGTPMTSVGPKHLAAPWPRKTGFLYPEDSYGVLCHWQYGNLVNTLADRLAVSARYSTGKYIGWFLEPNEVASRDRLNDSGRIRYIVLDAISVCDSFPSEVIHSGREVERFQVIEEVRDLGHFDLSVLSYGDEFRSAVGARLYLGDGTDMSRYRLVYESPHRSFLRYRALPELEVVELKSTLLSSRQMERAIEPLTRRGNAWQEGDFICYSGSVVSSVKIFECVAGATIGGRTEDNGPITLTLKIESPVAKRKFDYVRSATPSSDGRFSFRVPYSTSSTEDKYRVRAIGPVRIEQGATSFEVEVPEEAVLLGSPIHVAFP